jgi:hypothetical protein
MYILHQIKELEYYDNYHKIVSDWKSVRYARLAIKKCFSCDLRIVHELKTCIRLLSCVC